MLNKDEFVKTISKLLYKTVTFEQIMQHCEIVKSYEKTNGRKIHTQYHYLFSSYEMNKVIYFQEDAFGELEMGDLYAESSVGFTVFDSFSFY